MSDAETHDFTPLIEFLNRMPAISLANGADYSGKGVFENGNWWIKFSIDTEHPLAWRHVQEMGFVLNYLSINERLPTVFMPVSPPPYLNGGVEFLSWVIESTEKDFTPALCAQWLEGRLPRPVEDLELWNTDSDSDEEPSAMSEISLKLERPRVEALLARYKSQIGQDFPGYRNHVYRAITYAMFFLGNEIEHEQLVETAFVYHDIGLWTDHELAYLEPSEAAAIADNERYGWGLNPDLLRDAIHWHHKIFPYSGPGQNIVEACRKADWIDASKGNLRKGIAKAIVEEVEAAFPNLGFHDSLLRLAKDYGGSTIVGGLKVTRGIVKW